MTDNKQSLPNLKVNLVSKTSLKRNLKSQEKSKSSNLVKNSVEISLIKSNVSRSNLTGKQNSQNPNEHNNSHKKSQEQLPNIASFKRLENDDLKKSIHVKAKSKLIEKNMQNYTKNSSFHNGFSLSTNEIIEYHDYFIKLSGGDEAITISSFNKAFEKPAETPTGKNKVGSDKDYMMRDTGSLFQY